MPTTKSAKKRLRQSLIRRSRNRSVKSTLKSHMRKVRDAVTAGDLEKANEEFKTAAKKFDQAAAKRIIHANLAGRVKSAVCADQGSENRRQERVVSLPAAGVLGATASAVGREHWRTHSLTNTADFASLR